MKYLKFIVGIFLALNSFACISAQNSDLTKIHPEKIHPDKHNAISWVNYSAEYDAICYQTYNIALEMVKLALIDKSWSAIAEKHDRESNTIPAIILDIDQTAVNIMSYVTEAAIKGLGYSPNSFTEWINKDMPTAVPGALEFTRQAVRLGVKIIYYTARKERDKRGTFQQLDKLGFPLPDGLNSIFTVEGFASKTEGRTKLAKKYRIIMLIGDDAVDFFSGFQNTNVKNRKHLAKQYKDWWGKRWLILPNPTYGSWENALLNNISMSIGKKVEMKRTMLKKIASNNR